MEIDPVFLTLTSASGKVVLLGAWREGTYCKIIMSDFMQHESIIQTNRGGCKASKPAYVMLYLLRLGYVDLVTLVSTLRTP